MLILKYPACRDKSRSIRTNPLLKVHFIFAETHPDDSPAYFQPKEPVRIRVYLQSHFTAYGNTHQRQLQVTACPLSSSKIPALTSGLHNIDGKGLRAGSGRGFRAIVRPACSTGTFAIGTSIPAS